MIINHNSIDHQLEIAKCYERIHIQDQTKVILWNLQKHTIGEAFVHMKILMIT